MQHPPPEMTIFKTRYGEKQHLLFNTHTRHMYSTVYILVHFTFYYQYTEFPIFSPKNQTCLTKEFYKTIMLWWLGLQTDLHGSQNMRRMSTIKKTWTKDS